MAETGPGPSQGQRWFDWLKTALLVAVVLCCLSLDDALGEEILPDLNSTNDPKICQSVDIRSKLEMFDKLRDCEVVEGFVQILLFDNFNESSFSNITFPQLTEITDYLLLFRVNGLKTLSHMFPNLAVIRGQSLFFNYALVIFEMMNLQDIGLYSLTDITRGYIRIDKNPSLCFVNSIDWELIIHEKGDNFIKNIRTDNECPLCSGYGIIGGESPYAYRASCPNSTRENFNSNKHLCWNSQHCQKICSSKCGPNKACDALGGCCDEKCIGGCAVNQPKNCTVCRNFAMGPQKTKKCMMRCPNGFYEHLERRCVTREECENMKKPLQIQENNNVDYPDYPYKIFNRSCVLNCPPEFMNDYEKHTCVPCKGRCRKECHGVNIDTLKVATELKGCTHIVGSLEIQIRGGGNVVKVLEESLSMIEQIDGYLKIVRSFPLISLSFFKSLKVIAGKTLESDKYAFVVLDNQNLQDIWDWTNRTLTIGNNGRLFFHFNPKLCYYKIEELQQKAGLEPLNNDLEVAVNSNGDKTACIVQELNVTVYEIHSRGVILKWKPFEMEDTRKLLGYVIYSKKAEDKNVSLYDGRDACGGDDWQVHDMGASDDFYHLLSHLKPYTRYAFYVKTLTVAAYKHGAESPIQYFRTLADQPTEPRNVMATSDTYDSFTITWEPPLEPNGNITHYIVAGKRHFESDDGTVDRNYCRNPVVSVEMAPTVQTQKPKTDNNTCDCKNWKPGGNTQDKEKEVMSQIQFEDALHNALYTKRVLELRRKREINADNVIDRRGSNIITANEKPIDEWDFNVTIYGRMELKVEGLHHFSFYHIYVKACRERQSARDDKTCSDTALKTARTRFKDGANNITNVRVLNNSLDMVAISWDEPSDPNGIILSYYIQYKIISTFDTKPYMPACITKKSYVNASFTYIIRNLTPGNYSLQIAAVSHAGIGYYSDAVYFVIPEISSKSTLPLIISILSFFVLAVIVITLYLRKRKLSASSQKKLFRDINPEYVSTEYVVDEWEVQRKKVELKRELGQGSFGMVYEGLAKDLNGKSSLKCAVKTVNEHATNRERIEFLNEASVMKAFDTAHVVKLLGVVSQGQPTLVLMELMANGDLKSYLRSHRPDAENYNPDMQRNALTLKRILQMAAEIADGMAYLSAKKFVHRDLAARNCMVAEDLTVKIGDFGMTRDIYETDYYRKGTKGLLPVRWMAPESLKDGVFTSSSDIWSYGVVLWEMATLASQPYQGLSNEQVLRYVIDGGIMERPDNCPDKLYMLMQLCWKHKAANRPTFLDLCGLLVEDANPEFPQISFYHSSSGLEARNARITPTLSRHDPSSPLRGKCDPENFSLPNSEDESDQELNIDISSERIGFGSFPIQPKGSSTLANGHVNNRPTNGTATVQW